MSWSSRSGGAGLNPLQSHRSLEEMKIVFLGSSEFGLPTLTQLHEQHEVVLVVTQPDRPKGRKRHLAPTPIGAFAAEVGLTCIKPENVNDPEMIARIESFDADAMVVISFGQYLKQKLVNLPRLGALNLHASILPACRGAAPIHWSIIRNEPAGNSIIRIARRMDAGDILALDPVEVGPTETTADLHDRLAVAGAPLVLDTLQKLDAGSITPTVQDEEKATHAPKLGAADRWVDFSAHPDRVRRRINGLSPYPGVDATVISGEQKIAVKLLRAAPSLHRHQGRAGQCLDPEAGAFACGEQGAIQIIEIQPPGKRAMLWQDFAAGHPIDTKTQMISSSPEQASA